MTLCAKATSGAKRRQTSSTALAAAGLGASCSSDHGTVDLARDDVHDDAALHETWENDLQGAFHPAFGTQPLDGAEQFHAPAR
jgi:hypothetical protein